jgi:transcriptional regulator with XRE-family HTH domain
MATDQGPVVQSALLRGELVRLRRDSKLTQEQVAAQLDWSESKLIRVEGGRSSITKVDLDALLTAYGITSESKRDELQALNRGARRTGWWDKYRDHIPQSYLNYVGFETGATFIRQFESVFIPGTLQTREYAEAVTAGTVEVNSVGLVMVGSIVGLRLDRQAEMAKRSPQPRRYYVVDEAVIHRHVGIDQNPTIMPDQLRSLADRAEGDDLITVRVMPFKAGAHRGLGSFTLLEFEGGLTDVLYIDAGRGEFATMVFGGDQVTDYRDDFESLVEKALSVGESIELMRSVAEEMDRMA